jgi:hypothetical protein
MHNGYGAGDVAITIRELPEQPILPGATAVTFAGHSALYRRFAEPDPSFAWGSMPGPIEVWIVDIDGVVVEIAIKPDADTGISDASLADAHAIIDSMRYERTDRPTRGFRLLFTLTNGDWDSG